MYIINSGNLKSFIKTIHIICNCYHPSSPAPRCIAWVGQMLQRNALSRLLPSRRCELAAMKTRPEMRAYKTKHCTTLLSSIDSSTKTASQIKGGTEPNKSYQNILNALSFLPLMHINTSLNLCMTNIWHHKQLMEKLDLFWFAKWNTLMEIFGLT